MKSTKSVAFSLSYFLTCLLFFSCTLDQPSQPVWDNPFDVNNPDTHGDPYQIRARMEDEGIRVSWNYIDFDGITGYNLYRKVDDANFVNIRQTGNGCQDTTWLDTDVSGIYRYEYYVVARFADGEADHSHVRTAVVHSDPILIIQGESVTETPSRNVNLIIIACGAQQMLLSNSADFTDAVWEPFQPTREWQLMRGMDTKTVFLRVSFPTGDTSGVVFDQIDPAPLSTPSLLIAGGAATTTTRLVTLTIDAIASEMQLSNNPLTGSELWIPCAQTLMWMLDIGQGTKTVFLNIRNDFFGESATDDQIDPAPLNPSLIIAGGAENSAARSVPLRITANGAIQMQLSNSSFSGSEEWIEFANSIQWDLDSGIGTKTVRVKVRNDFLIEAEANDQIDPAQLNPNLNILPDSLFINHPNIILNMPNTDASEMKLANSSDSTGINWLPYRAQLPWNLASGDGWKKIFVWFRNDFYATEPVVDSVGYDTQTLISSFTWSSSGKDTLVAGDELNLTIRMADDSFGVETGGRASVVVDGWQPITLTGIGDGTYSSIYQIQAENPGVTSASVTALFTDRAHNKAIPLASDERLTMRAAGAEREFPLGNTGQTITMVWIPAGSFEMGSSVDEHERSSDEGPVHTVRLGLGFWMGKYEVTQDQWIAVMGSNPSSRYGVGADFPVYSISWEDIQTFEARLGETFRLPSEAEWEYACRSGTRTRFYWGDDLAESQIGSYAWFAGNSDSAQPVGHKTESGWGVQDISGNVWEWCEDVYHQDYTGAPEDGSAWTTGGGSGRILRGGCWTVAGGNCRSANRLWLLADQQYYTAGFRLVRVD